MPPPGPDATRRAKAEFLAHLGEALVRPQFDEALQRLLTGEKLARREPKQPYNGADGLPIRWSSALLPPGATLDPATGVFEWTPDGLRRDAEVVARRYRCLAAELAPLRDNVTGAPSRRSGRKSWAFSIS